MRYKNSKLRITCVVADVGKTRICVQEASSGVLRSHELQLLLKRSSGVYWSAITRRAESGSKDTRQADKMAGESGGPKTAHWWHSSRSWRLYRNKDLRLKREAQSRSSPCPNRPSLLITSRQAWRHLDNISTIKSNSFRRAYLRTEAFFRRVLNK